MTTENHVLRAVRSEASQRYLIRRQSYEGGGLVALEASNIAQRDKTVTQGKSHRQSPELANFAPAEEVLVECRGSNEPTVLFRNRFVVECFCHLQHGVDSSIAGLDAPPISRAEPSVPIPEIWVVAAKIHR